MPTNLHAADVAHGSHTEDIALVSKPAVNVCIFTSTPQKKTLHITNQSFPLSTHIMQNMELCTTDYESNNCMSHIVTH